MRFFLALLLTNISWIYQPATAQQKAASLHNPVLNADFPDPTVIRAAGRYYAYATQTNVDGKVINIQVASSTDLQHWRMLGDALPQKPSWASGTQDFWAPQVLFDKQLKKYILFYSGESNDSSSGKCLGIAFSNSPAGPFVDKGTPLLCGPGFEDIDPMAFVDPKTGKKLLYWGSGFKPIKVQELTPDWTALKPGTAVREVVWPHQEKNYDNLIEGAWVDFFRGNYYLFFSGDNCCGVNANYAVMVAKASDALGPFTRMGKAKKTGSSVVLEKNATWLATGHNSVFTDDKGKRWIAYHAIYRGTDSSLNRNGARVLCISRLSYKNGWPVVNQ